MGVLDQELAENTDGNFHYNTGRAVRIPGGESIMAITVEAIYENGVLKLSQPLPWKDGERVSVAVSSLESPMLKSYGIMGFKGTAEEADYFAMDPELDFPPPPEQP
jgi:predicted DNA-binding antitoxin AbrB/MazE fold protein